jgi:5-methyltetrahydropteroyltriglutamate--homocysteine methyltransferase
MAATGHRQPPFTAEHIGSLLRPPELTRARDAFRSGAIGQDDLDAIEDRAIRDVVAMQERVGLQVVTDGEFRRGIYSDAFTVGGISGIKIEATEDLGWSHSGAFGFRTARRIMKVVDRIAWTGPENAKDFGFLARHTTRTPKITLPGPAFIHYRSGRANISKDVYPDLDSFWADLAAAYRKEISSLYDAGCRYLQIDETSLVKLGDARAQRLLADRGDDWRDLLRVYIEVVNEIVSAAPADMRIGVHVCRSQDPSWQADTSYAPVAEHLFNDMQVDLFFLEYDNARAGGFEPLKLVPKSKKVVLGLVSSTSRQLEAAEYLKRRVEEATSFISLAQLGLSPQCGFSTSAHESDDEARRMQWEKLRLIVDVSRELWPAS